MATGDMKNNLRKLQNILKTVKYHGEVDYTDLSKGVPTAFLPIYHHVFVNYSHPLAKVISEANIELQGKVDVRFIEAVYKICREVFSYKPSITKEQFFSSGFAERKVIMCCELLEKARDKHRKMAPSQARSRPLSTSLMSGRSINAAKSHPGTAGISLKPKVNRMYDAAPRKTAQSPPPLPAPHVVNELLHPSTQPSKTSSSQSFSAPSSSSQAINNCKPSTRKQSAGLPPGEVVVSAPDIPQSAALSPPVSGGGAGFSLLQDTPSIAKVRSAQVEVVSIPRDEDSTLQPIDIIARTPLPPAGRSLNYRGEEQPAGVAEGGMVSIEQYEALLARLTLMENNSKNRPPVAPPIGQQDLDTLTARLTLLENRMAILEAKQQVPVCETTEEPEVPMATAAMTTDSPDTHKATLQQGLLTEDPLPSSPMSSLSPIAPKNAPAFPDSLTDSPAMDPLAPSPCDKENQQPPVMPGAKCSSTPTKAVAPPIQGLGVNINYLNTPDRERVDRIRNLMTDTEVMLQ